MERRLGLIKEQPRRGEARQNQNRIKEQRLGLSVDPTSVHAWRANPFGLLLSAAGYMLIETMRRVALEGTESAQAQVETIRL